MDSASSPRPAPSACCSWTSGFPPAYAAIRNDPTALAVSLVLYTTNTALALLLLGASIASLRLIPWRRMAMIVYAIALLVVTVIGNIVNGIFVMPRMFERLAAAPGPGGAGAAAAGKIFGVIAMVFGVLFAVAIASVILYFFTRTYVINAFKGIVPDDPNTFPVSYPDQANNPRT